MKKRIVNWKPVPDHASGGQSLDTHMPNLIAIAYRGELIDKILAMPRKTPITYEHAVLLASQGFGNALRAEIADGQPRDTFRFHRKFLEFISELGFHIELTGDELLSPSHSTN